MALRTSPIVAVCLVLGLAMPLSGCVSSSVERLRHAPQPAQLVDGDGVVVLGRRQHSNDETEAGVLDCVADKLDDGRVNVLSEQRFRDRMFPWFEPRAAPLTTDSLPRLLARDAVAERLRATGVRYIVWIDGRTSDRDKGGSLSCAAGPAGGGCLGFMWWENQAQYEASVWDVDNLRSVGQISVDATGRSYMPAVIIPVPLIARTKSAACAGVAGQVREFLQGG